jgi:DNA primase
LDKNQIKQHLLDNPNKIEDILENIDCHNIKIIKDKRIQCGLPSGDNNTSVQIFLDTFLSAKIYTRNDFENYEVKDIFTVVQFLKDYSLTEAINLVCSISNIEYTYKKNKNRSESYDFLKMFKRGIKKEESYEEILLTENFTKRFVREDCMMFLNDGVNSNAQSKFGVSYDILDNRIVFAIRNDKGSLLSFKGRTCEKDYKINGTPKFISYYPCNNNNYLFGLYENYFDILIANEVILVEAEKGVMQLSSMGINNAVSINKKNISSIQLKKLFKLNVNVVLALDKDVSLEEIFIESKKFKNLCDIYYIYDNLDLLGKKESPSDKGIEIFNRLMNECKFKYKGE